MESSLFSDDRCRAGYAHLHCRPQLTEILWRANRRHRRALPAEPPPSLLRRCPVRLFGRRSVASVVLGWEIQAAGGDCSYSTVFEAAAGTIRAGVNLPGSARVDNAQGIQMSSSCSNCQAALADGQSTCSACGSGPDANHPSAVGGQSELILHRKPSYKRTGYHAPDQGHNVYLETIHDGLYGDTASFPSAR